MPAKFLVCENPVIEPGITYIYHTKRPRFLVKVTSESPLDFVMMEEIDRLDEYFAALGGNRDELYDILEAFWGDYLNQLDDEGRL